MAETDRPRIVVFGAGAIGLSFIGQIFGRSGYEVIFVDTNESVVRRINAHRRYRVRLISPDGPHRIVEIDNVSARDVADHAAIKTALRDRPIVATAVGLRAFPAVLETLRSAVSDACELQLLDVLAAENIHDPRAIAQRVLRRHAPGVHPCSVGKMVPLGTGTVEPGVVEIASEAFNTLIVDGTGWRGPKPEDVEWITLVNDIEAWIDRKLFIHNLGHSACAWRARAIGPEIRTIAEAITRPEIRDHVASVMNTAARVLARVYPGSFSESDLLAHVRDLIHRFGNIALADTVERVGRDLERKLGRDERIVGAMLLAARFDAADAALGTLAPVVFDALRFGTAGAATLETDRSITAELVSARSAPKIVLARLAKLSLSMPEHRRVLAALNSG